MPRKTKTPKVVYKHKAEGKPDVDVVFDMVFDKLLQQKSLQETTTIKLQ